MEQYKGINIENPLKDGDCALNYEVIVQNGWKIIHCICPFDRCKTIEEAIDYYFEHFHKPQNRIIKATIAYFSREELKDLSMAC